MAENMIESDQPKPKRVRHRKKQLYENILKQMEFYFSDASLTKDRFLENLTKQDPWVPLEVFLKFNKILTMTNNIKDIANALKHSTLLDCSEDNLKIKRKFPVQPYDADERTVYVESIPVMANHAWVESIFQQYGTVAYISLPKFPKSNKIKGFAFIEFSKPEEAQKCLSEFDKMGCKLPTGTSHEELSSLKMFNITGKTLKSKKKEKREHKDSKSEVDENKECDYEPAKKKQKTRKPRKGEKSLSESDRDSSLVGAESQMDSSELSESEQNNKSKDKTKENIENQSGSDKNDTQSESERYDTASENEKNAKSETLVKKKTVRKRSKKEKKEKSNAKLIDENKGSMYGLQVLSKADWKKLRNKYLNLQRKQMSQLKKAIRSNHPPMYKEPMVQKAEQVNEVPVSGSGIVRKEGVLVKVELPEMCLDVRKLKQEVRTNIHVQHVDVKEGQSQMVIRFDTPDSAQQYCNGGIYNSARVLSGSEADECWSRAESEWASRRRGRDKLRHRVAALAAHRQPSTPVHGTQATTPALTAKPADNLTSNPSGPTHIKFED